MQMLASHLTPDEIFFKSFSVYESDTEKNTEQAVFCL